MTSRNITITCLLLFAFSLGVRLIVWQNNKIGMAAVQSVVSDTYKQDARLLTAGDLRAFISGPDPPSDANILGHPPGYPIFIGIAFLLFGDSNGFLIAQIALNSLASVFVFGIALRAFEFRTATIAGLLTALAPQFAYHSALALPDELSVVPLLGALYLVLRGFDTERLIYAMGAGAAIGISCWLRSNAMLLPVFLAIGLFLLFPRIVRVRFGLALALAFLTVIAPITLRNAIVFHAFIPLSLGAGTTFLEGLGDYDTDGRLGLPKLDEDVMRMDVARSGRADYYGYLYAPDGIARERARLKDGIAVVTANPVWYAKAVLHRAMTALRMERVPAIAPERDERETTSAILYYANIPLKFFQRAFITALILPLFLIGFSIALVKPRHRRPVAIISIIPLYYMLVQSLLHTEYRYVLAVPHVMLIFVAVAISFGLNKLWPVKSVSSNVNGEAGA